MAVSNGTNLTVVIPTKNRPQLVLMAVQSTLDQLVSGDEVIVVDDGSDVAIEPALRAYVLDDDEGANVPLRVLRNETPQRAAAARNRGVSNATTPWIVFLDDDDAFAPGYLDALRAFWTKAGDVDYGCGAPQNDRTAVSASLMFQPLPHLPSRSHLFPLSYGVWISRHAFNRIGGLQPDLTTNEDTEFCINMVRHGLRGVRSWDGGMLINEIAAVPDRASEHQEESVTKTTKASARAQCFRQIIELHANWFSTPQARVFRTFCLRRMIELQAKAREPYLEPRELAGSMKRFERFCWRVYYLANRFARALQIKSNYG